MSERDQRTPGDPYDARAMLAAFREARGPGPDEVDSVWNRLELDVAVDPLPTEQRVAVPWRVIVLAAGAIAAAFVLGWWLRGMPMQAVAVEEGHGMANRSASSDPTSGIATPRERAVPARVPVPLPEAESESAPESESESEPESASESEPESESESESVAEPPAAPKRPRPSPKAAPHPAPDPDPAPAPPAADTLAAEATVIRAARRALASGSPSSALEHLADFEARFPHGKLTEEADAIRTMAGCTLQPERAAPLAASFRGRHPGSLQQSGVDRACDG